MTEEVYIDLDLERARVLAQALSTYILGLHGNDEARLSLVVAAELLAELHDKGAT